MVVSLYSNLLSFALIAVLITTQAWSSEYPTTSATPDSTQGIQQLRSEESFFAIAALLDSKLEAYELMDSLAPYTRDLHPDHRTKLYKQYSRWTVHSTFGIGSIVAVLQGDGTGIGLVAGGVGLIAGTLVLTSNRYGSPAIANIMLYSGFGCLIASAIRAGNINDERKEYNNVLRAALRVSDDTWYRLTPTIRQLPDGTIAPSLALYVGF